MKIRPLLTRILIQPKLSAQLTLRDWDLLVRQARHANLLGRLAASLMAQNLLEDVPAPARAHLDSALSVARRQKQAVRWEVDRIAHALLAVDTPVILLKGAAYIMRELPTAEGRLFSDVDILVTKSSLEDAELNLKIHGWITTHHDAYDQQYYRKWMHELPPMRHLKRQTVLDVHHTILPETARYHPDPLKLIKAAKSIPEYGGRIKVFAPVDMVLHSATHLFHEGELQHGLRDLLDLDSLLRHFANDDPTFWDALITRAVELDLRRPLYYALRYTRRVLETPMPDNILRDSRLMPPSWLKLKWMDALFMRAFTPPHPSCEDRLTPWARFALYIRGHWLRMPMQHLIPHLWHQAFSEKPAE